RVLEHGQLPLLFRRRALCVERGGTLGETGYGIHQRLARASRDRFWIGRDVRLLHPSRLVRLVAQTKERRVDLVEERFEIRRGGTSRWCSRATVAKHQQQEDRDRTT